MQGGVKLGGSKFTFLRHEPGRSVYVKQGSSGAIIVKTGKAIIIAFYDDKIQPGACAKVG